MAVGWNRSLPQPSPVNLWIESMRSPLAPETVLQNRYRLLKLVAEGGFAQTYLAEDRGRFGERCVVKEFCPNSSDATVFEKAQELFQREAQTLYKLEHPQIPKFRALFTETLDQEKRLFLVQDYVEGQTYRAVLRQRSQSGKLFSESEIRQLLNQLLPVLSYIHGLGLIHRDLSLENLILRTADQTPVLIDFGVVKTVVTQLQQTRVMPSGTAVGKFGFAPIEQLQSGRAYPSSDLYSLAVCCLVLLTGREPTQLFDDVAAAWNWRPHTTVTPELAAIFDRMLAHKPSDRYSTATEVLQSLQSLPPSLSPPAPQSPPLSPSPDLSQVRTIAVDSPEPIRISQPRAQKPFVPPVHTPKAIATPAQSSPKRGPLILAGLATALLSAGAGWFAIQFLTQRPWVKQKPVASPSPAQVRSSKPSPTIRYSESLKLAPGQSVAVQGNLQPGEALFYRFEGTAGDVLSAQLNGSGVSFSLLRSDLSPLNRQSQGVADWQGTLPESGPYFVKVQNDPANSVQAFQLALALAKPAPPQPSATPTPSASLPPSPSPAVPVIDTAALNLGPDAPIQRLSGQLAPAHVQRYAVSVQAGQVLSAAVADDKAVTLTIRNPEGQPLSSAQNVLNWQSLMSEAGTYQVEVVPLDGTVPTNFAVDIGLQQTP
jgi:serine/threonine protein kinase